MKNKISPWAWVPTLYFAEGLPNVIVTIVSLVARTKQCGNNVLHLMAQSAMGGETAMESFR